MNSTYVLGFVMLRGVVKIFLISSSSFARKTTGRNRARSHSGHDAPWRRNGISNCLFRVRQISSDTCLSESEQQLSSSSSTLSSSDVPEPEFQVIFGYKWDPLTSAWRQGGASPERLAELPKGVSPLQKRIWKWDFYHCSSCNFLLSHMFLSFMVRTSPFRQDPLDLSFWSFWLFCTMV